MTVSKAGVRTRTTRKMLAILQYTKHYTHDSPLFVVWITQTIPLLLVSRWPPFLSLVESPHIDRTSRLDGNNPKSAELECIAGETGRGAERSDHSLHPSRQRIGSNAVRAERSYSASYLKNFSDTPAFRCLPLLIRMEMCTPGFTPPSRCQMVRSSLSLFKLTWGV
jgi:hypothetical protein